jgi:hypothetical protein
LGDDTDGSERMESEGAGAETGNASGSSEVLVAAENEV